jgi:hypothetical protein
MARRTSPAPAQPFVPFDAENVSTEEAVNSSRSSAGTKTKTGINSKTVAQLNQLANIFRLLNNKDATAIDGRVISEARKALCEFEDENGELIDIPAQSSSASPFPKILGSIFLTLRLAIYTKPKSEVQWKVFEVYQEDAYKILKSAYDQVEAAGDGWRPATSSRAQAANQVLPEGTPLEGEDQRQTNRRLAFEAWMDKTGFKSPPSVEDENFRIRMEEMGRLKAPPKISGSACVGKNSLQSDSYSSYESSGREELSEASDTTQGIPKQSSDSPSRKTGYLQPGRAGKKMVGAYLEPSLINEFRIVSENQGMTMQEMLTAFIVDTVTQSKDPKQAAEQQKRFLEQQHRQWLLALRKPDTPN